MQTSARAHDTIVAASATDTATTTIAGMWECMSGLTIAHPAHIFDNIYHHELKERLPWTGTAHEEQRIHCVRGAL